MKPSVARILWVLSIYSFFVFAQTALSQETSGSAKFHFDFAGASEAPKLGGMPSVGFPDEAIRNGVEGVLVAEMTLAPSGKVEDIVFTASLPFGYEQAVIDAFAALNFTPAKKNGEPVPVRMIIELTISMVFREGDKKASKPEITEKPEAGYPGSELADKRKGDVTVEVLFKKDGTLEILSVGSTMPKAFDEAAKEAAKNIRFIPGIHKKSEKPVSVKMSVVYKFKPE